MEALEIKKKIIDHCLRMEKDDLTTGTGGNISIKYNDKIYITPSGVDYEKLKLDDISVLDGQGEKLIEGKKPSSEKEFHIGIYNQREDVKSIIHTHSTYSTVLACMKKELPPIHYLVALAGGRVPVAEYAKFGTKELSENILSVIENYNAVFMANHGLLTMGSSIESAYSVALNIEFVSKVYVNILGAGNPVILSDNQIKAVEEKLKNYINPYFSKG